MAKLATCFKDALSNIEPADDAEHAALAHAEVSAALRADDHLRTELGVDPILIGSYGRDVSIKRVKDVDVFARLTKAGNDLRPSEALDKFEDVLVAEFGADRVERQHRSFKVDFPDYDLSVDVVPARPCGEHWEIPQKTDEDTSASWVETNPTKMTELKTEANAAFLLYNDDPDSGIYVPIVKLVQQVRRVWVSDQPGGFYFEVLAYWAFQEAQPDEDSVGGYLTTILDKIADLLDAAAEHGLDDPTLDGCKISTKATTQQIEAAATQLQEAADLAAEALTEPDSCQAAVKWRKLLGQTKHTEPAEHVFPLPSFCNADGSTKATSSVTKGASTVPAGSDRYA